MPVDIASGAVALDLEDLCIPGKVDLSWTRNYSTDFLTRPASLLGRGWTSRYFSTLTRTADGFEFLTPRGSKEFFRDPTGSVERGGRVVNFSSFLEIFRQAGTYIVQSWDVEYEEIWRYRFTSGQLGQPVTLVSIEDVTGQGLDLVWSTPGLLASVQQRLERRALLLSYTSAGLIDSVIFQAVTGERHIVARYTYDAQGQLAAAFDAADNADRYEYDPTGRLSRNIVKDGGVFTYRYDAKGRCVRSGGLDRYDEKRLRYFDAARTTEVTDSYSQTSRYQFLASGQLVRAVDPLGTEKLTEYDEHGRIVAKTDATGSLTRYTYDDSGNRDSVTDALGNTHSFTYNEHHLPLSMTDPVGQEWLRFYDEANRLVATADPLGHRWTIAYDSEGNVSAVQNPLGARKHERYEQGILHSVTDWMGNVTRFQLDAFGRVVARQGPMGESIRFEYDQLGNPVKVTLPDGETMRASYDVAGNLTVFIDGNGRTSRFRYGPCQQLLERIDPVGGVVRYVWGSEPGRLDQVTNEKGERYRFFRDAAGRIIRELSFDGAERLYQYDAEGLEIAYTNANGETVHTYRDALHRVVGRKLPDGGQVSYSFDPIGNLIATATADSAVAFERDPLGRVVREVQGGHLVESTYDPLGNLIRTATSLGHTVDYTVDANGAVTELTALGHTMVFQHNASGKETGRQLPGGVVMEQRYDRTGRLVEQRVGPGRLSNGNGSVIPPQREIVRRRCAYDSNGLLTSVVDNHFGQTAYVYDAADRLLQALREHGPSETFSYDPTGNLARYQTRNRASTDDTAVYGVGNRLLHKGATRYEYDAEGRRISQIEDADSDHPRKWSYEWNALDQLKTVTRPDGSTWRYKYDGLSRRIEKTGPASTLHLLWDGNVILHELTDQDHVVAWITSRGTFAPLAKVEFGSLHPVITDHLGTPREMLNASGTVVWTASLAAWGQNEPSQGLQSNTNDCAIRFQGQWLDEESGLHYNRFRYYDPTVAAYISQDPIGLAGGPNLYSYAKNPVLWIDPFGLANIDSNGFFAPSNEYGRGSGSGQVRIPYQGSRSRDFSLANRMAGFSSTPDGYTWHHANYNPRTGYGDMQLVRTSAHETPHAGGVSDFQHATGIKYDTPEAVQHVEKKGRLRGKPCS